MTRIIRIIGKKDQGKTTLVCEIIDELIRLGYRVGSMKHTSHKHDIDQPGKDSFRHRESGANPAALATQGATGFFFNLEWRELWPEFARVAYKQCDFLVVEGGAHLSGKKIEVWRNEKKVEPWALENKDVIAIVTDDLLELDIPVFKRSDLIKTVDSILKLDLEEL